MEQGVDLGGDWIQLESPMEQAHSQALMEGHTFASVPCRLLAQICI